VSVGGEPPLLPEGPPAPPRGVPVSRGLVASFLTGLGYDPAWVHHVTISPRDVTVSVVAGELYPVMHTVRHPYAELEPVPEPGTSPGHRGHGDVTGTSR
jgi:hypothetical protein